MDAYCFLRQNQQEKYDLFFLIPIYHEWWTKYCPFYEEIPFCILLGVIIIETASDEELPKDILPFELRLTKVYGILKYGFAETEMQEDRVWKTVYWIWLNNWKKFWIGGQKYL